MKFSIIALLVVGSAFSSSAQDAVRPFFGDRDLYTYVGQDWVLNSDAEIAAVMAARQVAKPIERKVAENTYLTLCQTALAAAADQRATNVPPAKLTFAELATVMDTIMTADPQAAIVLTLKMLATDAALKRFDLLWWEDTEFHPEIVSPTP